MPNGGAAESLGDIIATQPHLAYGARNAEVKQGTGGEAGHYQGRMSPLSKAIAVPVRMFPVRPGGLARGTLPFAFLESHSRDDTGIRDRPAPVRRARCGLCVSGERAERKVLFCLKLEPPIKKGGETGLDHLRVVQDALGLGDLPQSIVQTESRPIGPGVEHSLDHVSHCNDLRLNANVIALEWTS